VVARIVVTGLIAQYPLGGLTWHYLHYVLGLARLGHEVLYLEDSGQWPYNPEEGGTGRSCDFNVRYLGAVMERYDMGDRWAYRFVWTGEWFGMPDDEREAFVESADLVLNVSGTLERPQELRRGGRLAYIDTDPVFTQIRLARRQRDITQRIDAHDLAFSFGEVLGSPLPATRQVFLPTRQPIVLDEWAPAPEARDVWTTVMNWTSYRSVEWQGRTYGQKNEEFLRFLDLPARVSPVRLELALAAGKTERSPYELLRRNGWEVVDPGDAAGDLDGYRQYVTSSRGEWSVAKNGYVVGHCGWFSERSACYLAAGRPVVVQDTGFGAVLPVGEGLLTFHTLDEARAALRAVEADHDRHARAARAIAEEFFDADRVLTRLLEDAFA
jgi:hypothetical protein